MSRGDVEVANVNAMEIVRVGSFREINRTDESVIFQHYFHISPGVYTLSAMVRDIGGSRNATQQATVRVPLLRPVVSQLRSSFTKPREGPVSIQLPRLLASPRSSAVFGRDSTVAIYVEAYGLGTRLPVDYVVRNDKGKQLWRDSASSARKGSLFNGIVNVPISAVGVGIARVLFHPKRLAGQCESSVVREFWRRHSLSCPSRTCSGYLRFFASPHGWQPSEQLRWKGVRRYGRSFSVSTDPIPETPTNEEMQAYFGGFSRPTSNSGRIELPDGCRTAEWCLSRLESRTR